MANDIENKNGGCPFNTKCLDVTGLTTKQICTGQEGNWETCEVYVIGLNEKPDYYKNFMPEGG